MAGNAGLLAGIGALSAVTWALVCAALHLAGASHAPPGERASAAIRELSDPEPGGGCDTWCPKQGYRLPLPSGRPSTLSCSQAKHVVRQALATLVYEPEAVTGAAFAPAVVDWLDPYGLWSASTDSPVPLVVSAEGAALIDELLADDEAPCRASASVGDVLVAWTTSLVATFDAARRRERRGGTVSASMLGDAAAEELFADEDRPSRELADVLGRNGGRFEKGLGEATTDYIDVARSRYFPSLDREGWAGVVRAAAVRAYIQSIDPHGQWAPLDEEASVFDVDLDARASDRLWDEGGRTAVGVSVRSGPLAPLAQGDVVLSIAGVVTAGLPTEQIDQLMYAAADTPVSAPLVVLRRGERSLRVLELPPTYDADGGDDTPEPLPSYRVKYGGSEVLVVPIHDVRSDLGGALAITLRVEHGPGASPPAGLLLDLRDNGGGSTEGAIAAIGLLLPGVPLFPMLHRDGSIEVDRASEPPLADRWSGPVAVLVDGGTASAAEMLAGAIQSYGRGRVVGSPTYGKGCAQEYFDDAVHAGVLRLTTLLYALPDGAPVQGVGLRPALQIERRLESKPAGDGPREREADVPNAPPTWRGPDVRDRTRVSSPTESAWPRPRGTVGPCRDEEVCRALEGLGGLVGDRTE